MIVSNYTKLFSIEFLHDAYGDNADLMGDISIIPDEETTKIMNGNRLFYKIDRNTFFCFVQTVASIDTTGGKIKVLTESKPLISIDECVQLNFRFSLNSGYFLNASNLRLFILKNKIFRFGNDSGNKQSDLHDVFYLSKKIPVYDNAKDYTTGMLVIYGVNKTFEAIKENNAVTPHDPGDPSYWREVPKTVQYINQEDLVNDSENENCFATLKILFSKSLANDFSFLEGDNTIKEKEYIIHFKKK